MDRPENPGLYLHLPFCSAICPYCDFYVLTGGADRRRQYIEHLLQEITLCGPHPWPAFVDTAPREGFDTLYLGGGTPSILGPEDFSSLREGIDNNLPLDPNPWIGLEANPEDVDEQALAAWEEMGVEFLSLGIQSFDDEALRFLGRRHNPQASRDSVSLARSSRIETLSLDLIYGLPDQTEDDWEADLRSALELEPDHLSCYQLTIEPRTPFGFRRSRGQLDVPPPERQADLFFLTHRLLAEHGLVAYEISNFATASHHRSRHNSKYWNQTPYLGLGPSAHSFASRQRWWNARKIKPYEGLIDAGRRPIEEYETLTPGQQCLEILMLGLRTPAGVDFGAFPDGSGSQLWHTNRSLMDDLEDRQLVTLAEQRLIPTLAGLAVAEAIAGRFELLEP